jgi:hypothetical protein
MGIPCCFSRAIPTPEKGKPIDVSCGNTDDLSHEQALNRFVSLADEADEVPNLARGRKYEAFKLSGDDWSKLHRIHQVLSV